jgi:DNA polymerase-3 subunit alpha
VKAYLYLDVETTGLNPKTNDVVQLAAIPVIGGIRQTHFNEFCQPFDFNTVEQEAVNVHGITIDKMKTFQSPLSLINKLEEFVKAYGVKFTIAGYNCNFDKAMLGAMFLKAGKPSLFRQLFDNDVHDVYGRAKSIKNQLKTTSLKLSALASEFGINISAHEALSDISATIEVDLRLSEMLGDSLIDVSHTDKISATGLQEPPQLHVHSEYSNADSVSFTEDWVRWAIKNKVPALAFPDHGISASLFKASNPKSVFDKINKEDKTKYIGNEVQLIPAISLNVIDGESYFRLNAWATSNEGYFNLVRLSSIAWQNVKEDEKVDLPLISLDDVKKYQQDVIFGTACEKGILNIDVMKNHPNPIEKLKWLSNQLTSPLIAEYLAYDVYKTFKGIAGFISVGISDNIPDGNLTSAINTVLRQWVQDNRKQAIISSAAHFISEEEKILQDVISKSSYKDGRYFYESRHQRTIDESYAILKRHFNDEFSIDEAEECCVAANGIALSAEKIKIKHDFALPKSDIPEDIVAETDDYNMQTYLLTMRKIKEHGRWKDDPVYVARFKKEIDVILKNKTLNFLPYFLMYEDIGSYARSQGILQGLGRGSAGGSLLSYYLKIIHVDPIQNNLPFERFLSHARINAGSFPDIDADFGTRGPILAYLKDKYKLGFAQIGTFQKFKIKNALKDAMYALFGRNRADREIMDVCDTIPDSPQGIDEYDFVYGYTDSEGIIHRGLIEQNEMLRKFFSQYPEIEEVVRKMLGLPRGIGRHPSGFVISTKNLQDIVPTTAMEDKDLGTIIVTQFESPMIEKSGLIKADILGVTTIDDVTGAVNLIKQRTGKDYTQEDVNGMALLYRLPEDAGVYRDFFKRETDSSFQFNTDLIKKYLPAFKPEKVQDLSALTALCRPGALDVEALPGVSATQLYVDVRNKKRDPIYIHPDLEEILAETNSVVAYQEQLMAILVRFCGYSLEESDQIRSAIAKKKHDVMTKAFERVREETGKLGWTAEQSQGICNVLTAYSNYSFNLSHSYCYGMLGYITMYLKHHHPLEWWCAVLNSSGEDKMRHYISVLGDLIIPPTLSNPSAGFEIIGDKIAAPLSVVKGLGEASIKEIVKNGPYETLEDFITRVTPIKVNAGHFGGLLKSRSVDCFMDPELPYPEARRQLMDQYLHFRKSKGFTADLNHFDPVSIFLMERNTNKCFYKHLMEDKGMLEYVQEHWPALTPTGHKALPFRMGTSVILASSKVGGTILEKLGEDDKEGLEVGFFGLFQSSSFKSGLSKRTGRPWKKVDLVISDGVTSMECTWWDQKKALGFPTDSIVFVRGILKKDWKGNPSIDVREVQMVGEESMNTLNVRNAK